MNSLTNNNPLVDRFLELVAMGDNPETTLSLGNSYYDAGDYDQAYPYYEQLLEPDPEVKLKLAVCYLHCPGSAERDTILSLLLAAKEAGQARACYWLGMMHGDRERLNYFMEGAQLHDPRCQYKIGDHYYYGLHLPVNLEQAEKWALLSFNKGNADAVGLLVDIYLKTFRDEHAFQVLYENRGLNAYIDFKLGWCYHCSIGTFPDPDKALYYMNRAKDKNNPDAFCFLGYCYLYGDNLPKNPALGKSYLTIAAEKRFPHAKMILGKALLYGLDGLPQDVLEGERLMQELANENNGLSAEAFTRLGLYHMEWGRMELANSYLLEASKRKNYPHTFTYLGSQYYLGRDFTKAQEFFTMVKERPAAAHFLGKIAENNNDPDQALRNYRYAAIRGVAGACYDLGRLTLNRNRDQGIKLMAKALKMGYSPFIQQIGTAKFLFPYTKKELKKVVKMCELLAEESIPEALHALGEHFQRLADKKIQALECFSKAANLGFTPSQRVLGRTEKGIDLLQQAAEIGDSEACSSLGEYYYSQKQMDQAVLWYKAANSPSGDYCLAMIYLERDPAESFSHAEKSARAGFVPAMLLLADELQCGAHYDRNPESALMWYEWAYHLGCPAAGEKLGIGHFRGIFGKQDLDQAHHYLAQNPSNPLFQQVCQEREKKKADLSKQLQAKKKELTEKYINRLQAFRTSTEPYRNSEFQGLKEFAANFEQRTSNYLKELQKEWKVPQTDSVNELVNLNAWADQTNSEFSYFCDKLAFVTLSALEHNFRLFQAKKTQQAKEALGEKISLAIQASLARLSSKAKEIERRYSQPLQKVISTVEGLQNEAKAQLELAETAAEVERFAMECLLRLANAEKETPDLNKLEEGEKQLKAEQRKIVEMERTIARERTQHAQQIAALRCKVAEAKPAAAPSFESSNERTGFIPLKEKCLTLISVLEGDISPVIHYKQLETALKENRWSTYQEAVDLLNFAGFYEKSQTGSHRTFHHKLYEKYSLTLPYKSGEKPLPTYRAQLLERILHVLEAHLQGVMDREKELL